LFFVTGRFENEDKKEWVKDIYIYKSVKQNVTVAVIVAEGEKVRKSKDPLNVKYTPNRRNKV
jgi:hypothetical protein